MLSKLLKSFIYCYLVMFSYVFFFFFYQCHVRYDISLWNHVSSYVTVMPFELTYAMLFYGCREGNE